MNKKIQEMKNELRKYDKDDFYLSYYIKVADLTSNQRKNLQRIFFENGFLWNSLEKVESEFTYYWINSKNTKYYYFFINSIKLFSIVASQKLIFDSFEIPREFFYNDILVNDILVNDFQDIISIFDNIV